MDVLSIESIKDAITKLPEQEKVSLAAWLNMITMDDWDRQMQRDFSAGGRGTKFLEQVKREIAEGPVEPLQKGFDDRFPHRS
jgi:hypothetical protein